MHGLSVATVMLAAALSGLSDERIEGVKPADQTGGGVVSVQIGAQVWMAANLDVKIDSTGKPLGPITYNDDASLVATYGLLYTQIEALRACRPGMTETQVMEIMDFVYRYRGAYLGFPTSVRAMTMSGRGEGRSIPEGFIQFVR